MTSVTIQLPDELSSALHRSPAELAKDVTLAAAIDWYRRGLVSQGRAAEIACVPRADFIEALAERKIDVVQVEPDELEQEVKRARSGDR
jgi:predicted HTH domain antitoxin